MQSNQNLTLQRDGEEMGGINIERDREGKGESEMEKNVRMMRVNMGKRKDPFLSERRVLKLEQEEGVVC